MSDAKCCECGKTNEQLSADNDDLRPYGPAGAPICYECAHSTQELEAEAKKRQAPYTAASAGLMLLMILEGREPVESISDGLRMH